MLKDKLDTIDIELFDVDARLSKLYDALETGKLSLDELAPRIKELKAKHDELSKARVQAEADIVVAGVQHVDAETVKSCAQDLKSLVEEAYFTQSKTFLRSFVKRVTIEGNKAKIQYRLPMPPDGKMTQYVGVLPINTLGGDRGIRTPNLCDANAALSQLSYIPTSTGQIITYVKSFSNLSP